MEDYIARLPDGMAMLNLRNVSRSQMAAGQVMTFETVLPSDAKALVAGGIDLDDEAAPKCVTVVKTKFTARRAARERP